MTQVHGYTMAQEVMSLFNWKSPAQVSATAKREGWYFIKVGAAHLYASQDVLAFRDTRYRTDLLRQEGWWNGLGLYRDEDIDVLGGCYYCGSFAIKHPQTAEAWVCLEGHRGGDGALAELKKSDPEYFI